MEAISMLGQIVPKYVVNYITFLSLSLTVSCRARTRWWISELTISHRLLRIHLRSLYPLSAMKVSPSCSAAFMSDWRMFLSGYDPHCNGPLSYTSRPPSNVRPNSHLGLGPWHLWEYHFVLKGCCSWIGQSVPSTDTYRVQFPTLRGTPTILIHQSI